MVSGKLCDHPRILLQKQWTPLSGVNWSITLLRWSIYVGSSVAKALAKAELTTVLFTTDCDRSTSRAHKQGLFASKNTWHTESNSSRVLSTFASGIHHIAQRKRTHSEQVPPSGMSTPSQNPKIYNTVSEKLLTGLWLKIAMPALRRCCLV